MTDAGTNKHIRHVLTLPNDIETIPQLNEFVDSFAEEAGLDMSVSMSLNLALEEAVVNVMSYAYPAGTKGDVSIEAVAAEGETVFTIRDSGTPFDPTSKEAVDTNLGVEERPIGGLGIHLVRQIMDHVSYSYTEGQNVLTLTKKL
ncbi:MAG: ATP-binding protein [Prevotella sp.]|nr:ATP-binding protein [Prevotella sp.]